MVKLPIKTAHAWARSAFRQPFDGRCPGDVRWLPPLVRFVAFKPMAEHELRLARWDGPSSVRRSTPTTTVPHVTPWAFQLLFHCQLGANRSLACRVTLTGGLSSQFFFFILYQLALLPDEGFFL